MYSGHRRAMVVVPDSNIRPDQHIVSDLHRVGGAETEVALDVGPVSYHDPAGRGIGVRSDRFEAGVRANEDRFADLDVLRLGDEVHRPRQVATTPEASKSCPKPAPSSAAADRAGKRTKGSHG